jgi:hypothetical protein
MLQRIKPSVRCIAKGNLASTSKNSIQKKFTRKAHFPGPIG